MRDRDVIAISVIVGLILGVILIFTATPVGVAVSNNYRTMMKKTDDATRYETRKKVEDTCRSMLSSYESDRLTYEQYKDSDNEEKQSWAEQAKMRANKTASTYNNFIMDNSFVWSDNVPKDIREKLDYLE